MPMPGWGEHQQALRMGKPNANGKKNSLVLEDSGPSIERKVRRELRKFERKWPPRDPMWY